MYNSDHQKTIQLSVRQRSETEVAIESGYAKSNLSREIRKELAEKLEHIVMKDSLFLIPKLSMEDLHQHTGMAKHNISEVLNHELDMSFYEYINSLRI